MVANVEVDIPDLSEPDAPVAMSCHSRSKGTTVELRSFDGHLYRSLGVNSSALVDKIKTSVFDPSVEITGCLSQQAVRRYFRIVPDRKPLLPDRLGNKSDELVRDADDERRMWSLSNGFELSPHSQAYAESVEAKARDRFSRLVTIDGRLWLRSQEMVYRTLSNATSPDGRVEVAIGGHVQPEDDPGYSSRQPTYHNPHTQNFSALSKEEAADFAGKPPHEFATIDVFDTSFVSSEFEATELCRCARNVLIADKMYGAGLPGTRYHNAHVRLRDVVENGIPDPDDTADILTEISAAQREVSGDEPSVHSNGSRAFTPPVIDAFVERWHSRPVHYDFIAAPLPK